MPLSTPADGTESSAEPTTTPGVPPNDAPTPATQEDGSIRAWFELAKAVRTNDTHDPTPGDTVLIVDKTYARVLACHPGRHLLLDDITEYDNTQAVPERWTWLCTQSDNFIGFRNLAEDSFLGHDLWWNIAAQGTAQKGWEHFVLTKQRDGYHIKSPFWGSLKPLAARLDGAGIEAGQPDGTLWAFVRVSE
ncbi:hypothetical protein CCM_01621 [Cordyceps militaris CM01]|uniref:Uncharacterized protein n=1 Tax=Cordyceps militaris (strain CM01) TaxID=983644 RepID=G3J663_CORMM|nr:uncharacterized protein CCM_01621 [Cordyceps militaris CM01]EGX96962.1 hypothetical protein CCM_01621 [Cordyceps militaris CM01]